MKKFVLLYIIISMYNTFQYKIYSFSLKQELYFKHGKDLEYIKETLSEEDIDENFKVIFAKNNNYTLDNNYTLEKTRYTSNIIEDRFTLSNRFLFSNDNIRSIFDQENEIDTVLHTEKDSPKNKDNCTQTSRLSFKITLDENSLFSIMDFNYFYPEEHDSIPDNDTDSDEYNTYIDNKDILSTISSVIMKIYCLLEKYYFDQSIEEKINLFKMENFLSIFNEDLTIFKYFIKYEEKESFYLFEKHVNKALKAILQFKQLCKSKISCDPALLYAFMKECNKIFNALKYTKYLENILDIIDKKHKKANLKDIDIIYVNINKNDDNITKIEKQSKNIIHNILNRINLNAEILLLNNILIDKGLINECDDIQKFVMNNILICKKNINDPIIIHIKNCNSKAYIKIINHYLELNNFFKNNDKCDIDFFIKDNTKDNVYFKIDKNYKLHNKFQCENYIIVYDETGDYIKYKGYIKKLLQQMQCSYLISKSFTIELFMNIIENISNYFNMQNFNFSANILLNSHKYLKKENIILKNCYFAEKLNIKKSSMKSSVIYFEK